MGDYYPGGATFKSYGRENSVPNNVLFQETESQDELNLGWYDFAGRQYDPFILRTPTHDPHASYYVDVSPYSFLDNNPVNNVDPTGMDVMNLNENGGVSSMIAKCPTCPDSPAFKPYIDDPNNTYHYDPTTGEVGILLPEVEVSSGKPVSENTMAMASMAMALTRNSAIFGGVTIVGPGLLGPAAITIGLVMIPAAGAGEGETEALRRMQNGDLTFDNSVLTYTPPPKTLPGFPKARPGKRLAGRKRWINDNGDILEWDSQHGDVEVYDRQGKHKGSADPETGEMTKPAIPGRKTKK